jgi:simple sugar transport system permease protein
MLFGGTVVAVVGLVLPPTLPGVVMVPLLIVVGIVAGGAFAALAGYIKAYHDVNPIISTIMLNFVAFYLVNFVATAPAFKDPTEGHPITVPLPESARIGFVGGIPWSLLGALIAVIFVWVLLERTRLGYEIRAVGYNQRAAETFGINFRRTIILTFALGGALAGLAGTFEVINIHGKLIEGFAKTSGAQYGILGILTSLVVGGSPGAVPVAGFLMAVLLVGADSLQRTMQVPVELVFVTQAVIVLVTVILRSRFARKGDG